MEEVKENDLLWNPRTQENYLIIKTTEDVAHIRKIYPNDNKWQSFWRRLKYMFGYYEPVIIDSSDSFVVIGNAYKEEK
jgi:hypothetical protein